MKILRTITRLSVVLLPVAILFACHAQEPSTVVDQNVEQQDYASAPKETFPPHDRVVELVLLHTNDHHGRFWPNDHGEYGLAARKTLVDKIRADATRRGAAVLMLSGGDVNTGVPESDVLNAEPDFRGMARIGYDAMAVGNHEFDNALDVIRRQQRWAGFPFLAANIYDEEGKRVFDPYVIVHKQGLRIGLVGFITPTTAYIGNKDHIAGLTFTRPEDEAPELIEELRPQVDLLIAVTHLGHDFDERGTDVSLAQAVSGFDAIIGGHSQQPICVDDQGDVNRDYRAGEACSPAKINGTWIMQAYEWGKYVGRADLLIEWPEAEASTLIPKQRMQNKQQNQNNRAAVSLQSYQLIPVNLKAHRTDRLASHPDLSLKQTPQEEVHSDPRHTGTWVGEYVSPDAELTQFLSQYQDRSGSLLSEPITWASAGFSRVDYSRPQQLNPLGVLIARAYRQATGADIAVTNAGGIRDGIPAGSVTRKTLLQVMPFGNHLITVEFTSAELRRYLRDAGVLDGNRKALQWDGISIDPTGGILVNDDPLHESLTYTLVTNSFTAAGGDNFPDLTQRADFKATPIVDVESVITYLRGLPTVQPNVFIAAH